MSKSARVSTWRLGHYSNSYPSRHTETEVNSTDGGGADFRRVLSSFGFSYSRAAPDELWPVYNKHLSGVDQILNAHHRFIKSSIQHLCAKR